MASNAAEMLHCTQLVLTRQPVLPAKLFKNATRGCCVCVCVCVMYMTLGHNKLTTFDHMDTGHIHRRYGSDRVGAKVPHTTGIFWQEEEICWA